VRALSSRHVFVSRTKVTWSQWHVDGVLSQRFEGHDL
jgi:hypothetical protein